MIPSAGIPAFSEMQLPGNIYPKSILQDDSRSPSFINRCNVPPWLIASEDFQADPHPIEIDGIRVTERWLFSQLECIPDAGERGRFFDGYIRVKFGLQDWVKRRNDSKGRPAYSYVDFLRAWGADSNRHAGAVLKAWVESRFGILATYHNGRLAEDAAARDRFTLDRMRGAAKSIGVLGQLDLLYTYCQDELRRRFPGARWRTLYRGTHDPEEYSVRVRDATPAGRRRRSGVVHLNNLSSFTSDPEIAWEFGSLVWKVEVPLSKIVFFSGLLPDSLLSGESEYLILGGHYKVETLL